jgi:hypothetical protein
MSIRPPSERGELEQVELRASIGLGTSVATLRGAATASQSHGSRTTPITIACRAEPARAAPTWRRSARTVSKAWLSRRNQPSSM